MSSVCFISSVLFLVLLFIIVEVDLSSKEQKDKKKFLVVLVSDEQVLEIKLTFDDA